MNLIKIFKFLGLYQSGRRMDRPVGSFARIENSYKDKTGRIRPIGKTLSVNNNNSHHPQEDYPALYTDFNMTFAGPISSQFFKEKVFQYLAGLTRDGVVGDYFTGQFRYGQDTESDAFSPLQNGVSYGAEMRGSLINHNAIYFWPQGNGSTCVVNNKMYLCNYVDFRKYSDAAIAALPDVSLKKTFSSLLRFDGIRIAQAGLPTPWTHHPITSGGTKRVRLVYLTMGLDAEPIMSNYIEYQITPTAGSIETRLGNHTAGMVPVTDQIGAAGVYFPTTREPDDDLDGNNNYDLSAISVVNSYMPVAVTDGFEIQCDYSQEPQIIGDWFMFVVQNPSRNEVYDAYYIQLMGYRDGNLASYPRFSNQIKGFNGYTSTWEDIDLADGPPRGLDLVSDFYTHVKDCVGLANTFMIVSLSDSSDGSADYRVSQVYPVLWGWQKTVSASATAWAFPRTRLGFLSSYMRDWYEHTVVKTKFPPVIGITNFSNLLLGYDENAIYFSDTSYGGSTEMTSGVANIVPPGSEFGKIVGCCGAENLLLIGRERKNYVLTGEITTGNVSYQECDVAIPGPANARAMSNSFADQIVFMNKAGIFSVGQSGVITELSRDIRDLFLKDQADHGCLFDRAIFKTGKPDFDGAFFKIVLDDTRGFILFLTGQRDETTKLVTQSNILVYDTNDGTWYEWSTPTNCGSVEVVDGKVNFFCNNSIYIESVANPEQVLTLNPLTLGEPSLEKQATQVKLYADMEDATPIRLKSQNDWKTDLVTDEEFAPDATSYIHKKRLNSSKPLAVAITIESQNNGIYLEGMEVEMAPVQEAMKK